MNGGGLFLDDRRYWLNGAGMARPAEVLRPCGLSRSDRPPAGVQPRMGEDPAIYLPRLRRDGWVPAGDGPQDGGHAWRFEKPLTPGWRLEKTFLAGWRAGANGESYADRHRLLGPDGAEDLALDWAEPHGGEILGMAGGCLWRLRPQPGGAPAARACVADLAPLTFTARPAPYPGVALRPEARA